MHRPPDKFVEIVYTELAARTMKGKNQTRR